MNNPLFQFVRDDKTGEVYVQTPLRGKSLLTSALLNKGTAFTAEERSQFNLLGKLPIKIETLEEQAARAYRQFLQFETLLQKNIYLASLYERNETLFYKLVSDKVTEMLPIIYTPIVGEAIKSFSREFRAPRGLYVSYPDRDKIETILNNRTYPDIDLIVASDAEGILGIGDQGVCGMDVPIAKLKVYTLFGQVKPGRCLPILLDVGTNNESLLKDPFYLGWRHKRISGQEYDEFIDLFVTAVKKIFPTVFLHWEDFSRENGHRILHQYEANICSFNDDIQGTGAVALAAVKAALLIKKETLANQKIVIFGGGNAGIGIADCLLQSLIRSGISPEKARAIFYIIDRDGLLFESTPSLKSFQAHFARPDTDKSLFNQKDCIGLKEVVETLKPTILIGCSAQAGAFNEAIIKILNQHTKNPIIFPLSNPTDKAEASPEQILTWTDGKAFVATGSPFDDVYIHGHKCGIAQCNNLFIFPGIGLGVVASKATRLTEGMIHAAADALSQASPALNDPNAPLLPPLTDAKKVSQQIARAVALAAIKEGYSHLGEDELDQAFARSCWEPKYLPLRKVNAS